MMNKLSRNLVLAWFAVALAACSQLVLYGSTLLLGLALQLPGAPPAVCGCVPDELHEIWTTRED